VKYWVFALTVVAGIAILISTKQPEPSITPDLVESQSKLSEPVSVIVTGNAEVTTQYLFDIYGHSATEVTALLNRAKDVYDNLSPELRVGLQIAMVLHGPDVAYFATDNYTQYRALVDLAASLDAFGFVHLKICVTSVRANGLESSRFPPFIELVPYGPAEITRLKSVGNVEL